MLKMVRWREEQARVMEMTSNDLYFGRLDSSGNS